MWKERGIEYEGYIWRSEIFDCVTRSSNLEFKRTPAFGSFVFFLSLFLFFPFCVSLWRKWASFFSLSISFLLFFWFFKFLSFTKTPQWKRWFLLYSSFVSNPPLLSLYTLSLSRKRKWQCSDKNKNKNKNIDLVTFSICKSNVNVIILISR